MTGNRRTGLVVGGVAVLALLVAGVWGAVLVRALGTDDPNSEAVAAADWYVMVDDLCDRLDYSAAFAILPKSGGGPRVQTIPFEGGISKECMQHLSRGSSVGSVWIRVSVQEDLAAAKRSYANTVEHGMLAMNSHTIETVDGPWQEGSLGLGAGAEGFNAGAEACVRDVNLNICAAMRVAMAPEQGVITDKGVGAAVLELAEEVLVRAKE